MKPEKFCGYTLKTCIDNASRNWEVEILNREGEFFKKIIAQSYSEAREQAKQEIHTYIVGLLLKAKQEN